jgi:hypothetical protein
MHPLNLIRFAPAEGSDTCQELLVLPFHPFAAPLTTAAPL